MVKYTDIGVETRGHIGIIELQKPPMNFFDAVLIQQIANALDEFDGNVDIRASVLCAQGKAFCAGADFKDPNRQETVASETAKQGDPADNLGSISHLYIEARSTLRRKLHEAGLPPGFWPHRCAS